MLCITQTTDCCLVHYNQKNRNLNNDATGHSVLSCCTSCKPFQCFICASDNFTQPEFRVFVNFKTSMLPFALCFFTIDIVLDRYLFTLYNFGFDSLTRTTCIIIVFNLRLFAFFEIGLA